MNMTLIISMLVMVPLALLLALSFFVLVTAQKLKSKYLRSFGYFVASFLGLIVLLAFLSGVYSLGAAGVKNRCQKRDKSMKMMMMEKRMPMAAESPTPAITAVSAKDTARPEPSCGNKGFMQKSKPQGGKNG